MKTEEEAQEKTSPGSERLKILKVPVRQEQIEGSVRGKTNKCMIHDAIKRDHPEFKALYVDKNQVRFTDPKANVIYTFPMSAFGKTMMLVWDDGGEIKPYDIWLRNPVVRERK